jgi:hypothetical protein
MMVSISSSTPTGAVPYTSNSPSTVQARPTQAMVQSQSTSSPQTNWGKILFGGIAALGAVVGLAWGGKTLLHVLEENKQIKQELVSASSTVVDEFKSSTKPKPVRGEGIEDIPEDMMKNVHKFKRNWKAPTNIKGDPQRYLRGIKESGFEYNEDKDVYTYLGEVIDDKVYDVLANVQESFVNRKAFDPKLFSESAEYSNLHFSTRSMGLGREKIHVVSDLTGGVQYLIPYQNHDKIPRSLALQWIKEGSFQLPRDMKLEDLDHVTDFKIPVGGIPKQFSFNQSGKSEWIRLPGFLVPN